MKSTLHLPYGQAPTGKQVREQYVEHIGTDGPFDKPYMLNGRVADSFVVLMAVLPPYENIDLVEKTLNDIGIYWDREVK